MKKTAITLYFLLQAACLFSQVPRPEYPRPQFERTDWINLNGEWTYTFDFGASGLERGYAGSKGFDGKIIVPFAPESKLSGVGHTDFIARIWYQRTIHIPAGWAQRNVMLNFGAVYYTSEVYVDGRFVGRHFGGSSSFSYDITAFVKRATCAAANRPPANSRCNTPRTAATTPARRASGRRCGWRRWLPRPSPASG